MLWVEVASKLLLGIKGLTCPLEKDDSWKEHFTTWHMSTRPVMCMSTNVSTCRYPVKLRITTGTVVCSMIAFNCKLSNICSHMNNSFWIHGRTTFQVT